MNPALMAMLKSLFGDKIDDVFSMIETIRNAATEMVARQERMENRLVNLETMLSENNHDRSANGSAFTGSGSAVIGD